MKPQLTPELIGAASMDAGNRSMRKAGRTAWTVEDYNEAARESQRLWAALDGGRQAALTAKNMAVLAFQQAGHSFQEASDYEEALRQVFRQDYGVRP